MMGGIQLALLLHILLLLSAGDSWAWTTTLPSSFSRFSIIDHQRRTHHRHQTSSRIHQNNYQPSHHHNVLLSATPTTDESTTTTTADDITISSILKDINPNTLPILHIQKRIGSGSYGTVHQGLFIQSKENVQRCITKRCWTFSEIENNVPLQIYNMEKEEKEREEELAIAQRTGLASVKQQPNGGDDVVVVVTTEETKLSKEEIKMKSERCKHYWNVEKHIFEKLTEKKKSSSSSSSATNEVVLATPEFLGVYQDDGNDTTQEDSIITGYGLLDTDDGWFSATTNDNGNGGHEWMVFEFVGGEYNNDEEEMPAQTLLDAMELDWKDQHKKNTNQNSNHHHHLYDVQKAMNLPESFTFGDTLDTIFITLLENLKVIHDCNIVHRDLKPGNLLCDASNQRLRIIDFGSAADLDPSPIPNIPFGTQRVGYDEGIASISPVYCAPETFVKLNDNPCSFDVFSAGLIMSQLLFNLLDERTDAGFLQQLKEVDYQLDSWLEKELGTKLRFSGFDEGLEYLGERRGLWSLLKQMFEQDPMKRITSAKALDKLEKIIGLRNGEVEWSDDLVNEVAQEEAYFETVMEAFESCQVNYLGMENMPRPLAFLASFKKGSPVGLLLAEASEVENDGTMNDADWEKWQRGTENAIPGEVFVKGWEDGSQADQLGIFEVGDRLRGVGELPFVDGGFEQAINLITRQPKGGSLKLHFDRISTPKVQPTLDQDKAGGGTRKCVSGQGTWKCGGRRGAQEDAFVLHEIKNESPILLAGVFDGHAGTAASKTCAGILPSLFTTELLMAKDSTTMTIRDALENAWETTCNTYRNGCDANGECVADYDPTEGILFADTGSTDLVAGTTATCAAISMNPSGTNELTILNCGDSRTLLVGQPASTTSSSSSELLGGDNDSVIIFETRDHSPDDEIEIERLEKGKSQGLDYSIPECSITSGSYMRVGDYQYALCRSLEGKYVTSKGIVSDPDVTSLNLDTLLSNRTNCAVVLACDGLFEVMSNEEVGREVVRMREAGYTAGDISKNLCGQALKKGSYDNLSVVVVYLDDV